MTTDMKLKMLKSMTDEEDKDVLSTYLSTIADKQDTSGKEAMSLVMFEINVYSNKSEGKKTECKSIAKAIDEKMFSMNFRRLAFTPVPNLEDATIYRIIARYSAATDGENFYRR